MVRALVQGYEHIHTSLASSGTCCFVVGSVLFFKAFEQYYTLAMAISVVGRRLC